MTETIVDEMLIAALIVSLLLLPAYTDYGNEVVATAFLGLIAFCQCARVVRDD